jgi:methionyl-tRNA synthetase
MALFTPVETLLLSIFLVWSFIWKGIALWKCGRNNQLVWFIALLVVNTAGILEIIYLLWFQRKRR